MSPPLNPYAESFQPTYPHPIVPPFSHLPSVSPFPSLLPPSHFHPSVLSSYPHPIVPPFSSHLPSVSLFPSLLPPSHFHPSVLPSYPHPIVPPFSHLPNFVSPFPSLLPPSHYFHPSVLPSYPHPHHHLLPSLPPPPTKLFSDYTHHGSLMMRETLDIFEGNRIGTGCFHMNVAKSLPPPPPPPSHERHQICTSKKQLWQPKSVVVVNGGGGGAASASSANVVDVPQFSSGQIQQFGSKTSVMIRNIPNQYCRDMLLKLLDKHCKEENEKQMMNSEFTKSAFDFFYLPIDFETECNKGYAFVNFTNPNGVWRLFKSLNCRKWDEFSSKKICEVTYARIQGKVALVKYFNSSTFACDKDEFLPVYFNPFRDGSVQDETVEMETVGTRTPRLLPSSSA